MERPDIDAIEATEGIQQLLDNLAEVSRHHPELASTTERAKETITGIAGKVQTIPATDISIEDNGIELSWEYAGRHLQVLFAFAGDEGDLVYAAAVKGSRRQQSDLTYDVNPDRLAERLLWLRGGEQKC